MRREPSDHGQEDDAAFVQALQIFRRGAVGYDDELHAIARCTALAMPRVNRPDLGFGQTLGRAVACVGFGESDGRHGVLIVAARGVAVDDAVRLIFVGSVVYEPASFETTQR